MNNKGFIKEFLNSLANNSSEVAVSFFCTDASIKEVSFKEFIDDIFKKASFFKEKGITKKHVGIFANNNYDWITIFFAILSTGNVAIPLFNGLQEEELKYSIGQFDIEYLIVNDEKDYSNVLEDISLYKFADIVSSCKFTISDVVETKKDETIVLLGTSGTTGKSKIVEISSDNLYYGSFGPAKMLFRTSMLLEFPMFHIGGIVATASTLIAHKKLCIGRGFKYFYSDLQSLNPASAAIIPSLINSFVALLKNNNGKDQKTFGNALEEINIGGAKVDESLCNDLLSYGIDSQNSYGMTETTGAISTCILNEHNLDSVGKIYDYVNVKILDDEILINSPTVMKGYYKDKEETDRIIKDGWLHTGDLGYIKDGNLYITGRKKNVIILSNGENVNPEEIEEKLYTCKDILECIVYSDGKGICANIYTKNENDVREFICSYNKNTSTYKNINRVYYSVNPLEKTDMGKIKRNGDANKYDKQRRSF